MGGVSAGLHGQGAPVLPTEGSLEGELSEVKGGLEGCPAHLDSWGQSGEATPPP